MNLQCNDEVMATLRPMFAAVEGTCEAWTDEEIVRRVFIRGAMEYARSAGSSWDEMTSMAAGLRAQL